MVSRASNLEQPLHEKYEVDVGEAFEEYVSFKSTRKPSTDPVDLLFKPYYEKTCVADDVPDSVEDIIKEHPSPKLGGESSWSQFVTKLDTDELGTRDIRKLINHLKCGSETQVLRYPRSGRTIFAKFVYEKIESVETVKRLYRTSGFGGDFATLAKVTFSDKIAWITEDDFDIEELETLEGNSPPFLMSDRVEEETEDPSDKREKREKINRIFQENSDTLDETEQEKLQNIFENTDSIEEAGQKIQDESFTIEELEESNQI